MLLRSAAAHNENPAIIGVLLKAGADPMAEQIDMDTPLHIAAKNNENPAVVEALLKAGADPMARNKDMATPLHKAAAPWFNRENSVVIIETLLKAGADLAALDKKGRTPLYLAKEYNENPAAREVLLAYGAGQIERQIETQRAAEQARKRGSKSGLGALVSGVVGATVANAAGLDEEQALAVGQDVADTVRTGQGTNRATMQVARQREAELRMAEQRAAENAALLEAINRELTTQATGEGGRAVEVDPQVEQARKVLQDALQEQRRQAAIGANNAKVMESNCSCIRIKDNGEYSCLDGLVVGNNSSGEPLCDIKR